MKRNLSEASVIELEIFYYVKEQCFSNNFTFLILLLSGSLEAVMEQLTKMLTGTSGSRFAPSLRFLALVSLCPDSDQNHGSIIANGNAASVGRRSALIKVAAFQCITSLRRTCEATP